MKCPIASRHGTVHCAWCRDHPGEGFPVECPDGYSKEKLPVGLGDVVHAASKVVNKLKIAVTGKGLGCFDQAGKLKPSSPCAKKRAGWNRVVIR